MKKRKSEILQGGGACFEIVRKIANAVLDAGGSDSDLRSILSDETVAPKFADILLTTKGLTFSWSRTYDTKMTWSEMKCVLRRLNRHIPQGEKRWRLPDERLITLAFKDPCLAFCASHYWTATKRYTNAHVCVSPQDSSILSYATNEHNHMSVRFVR